MRTFQERQAEPEPVIEMTGVSRSFGGKTVLDSISLRIGRGEIFGLLGPSGSGKTTLVKLLTGIDKADSGEIRMFGEPVPKLSLFQRFGYMAQSDALYPELAASENLKFFSSLFGLAGARQKERIREVMRMVDLSDHLDKPVAQYSGGMKRRLSLAISLLHEPDLLILDEPTVGIDPLLRRSIWRELFQLRDRGTTILMTTHVMDEAEKCDRIGLLREGRLHAADTPEGLKAVSGTNSLEDAFIVLGGGVRT